MPRPSRISFFGATIDCLTMGETVQAVENIIKRRDVTQHVVVNVAKLVMMQRDERLRQAVNGCGLINADGQGIVWGARILGLKLPERVAGIDLMLNLVARSHDKGYRIYLLGAREDVLQKVVSVWLEKFPGLQIAGCRNGYFSQDEEEGIVADIRNSRADIVFVAMSSPKKEFFLNRYLQAMQVPFVMGVGGSFDVVAGATRRAPVWMQRCGLEWFYRFLCEPGRMWKRYLMTNTVYLGMLLRGIFYRKDTAYEV